MRCELHEVDNCSYCTGVESKVQGGQAALPKGFVYAQHPGRCSGCGEWFNRDAVITADDRERQWIAECCNGYAR